MIIVNGELWREQEFLDFYKKHSTSRYDWNKKLKLYREVDLPKNIRINGKDYWLQKYDATELELMIDELIRELDSYPAYHEQGERELERLMRIYAKASD